MAKILIIEDDLRVAELIQRGLEEQGFKTTLAYDGLSGKKLAFQHHYDLLISDIILPKLDGLALCQQIKESKPGMPIIMLTALGTTDDKVEGFDAGADDYLVKPFEMRELSARIRALLKRNNNPVGISGNTLKNESPYDRGKTQWGGNRSHTKGIQPFEIYVAKSRARIIPS
jgi:DNA-binding response OmpR family regulator